ncbi:uncharacterized protein [Littorina saxatilis]|uniref:uncharacterized protein n=1 Tax=Littorina saxatilis TaxID=31220 RepID=UPI0038B4B6CD
MKCKKVWMKTGTAKRRQYIPVHNIAKRPDMEKAKLQNLIGFHAITGSDSTSFLSGQGKVSGWKVFQQHHQLLANLGKGQLTDDTSKEAEQFVCKLYISNCETADGARTIMFRKATAPENLPPSSDALSFHIKRAHYQASVWQQAHEKKPNLPPIESMGWQLKDGVFLPVLKTLPSVPDACLDIIFCTCQKQCSSGRSGMRNSGTWATEVEIYSAALMLNTRICVYRNVVGQSAWHTLDPRLIAPLTHCCHANINKFMYLCLQQQSVKVLRGHSLRKSVLPNLAVRNGLEFPAIPSTLEGLTTLEERCISPRIPFMQMRELGCDHQFGIRGNVVNVPVDVPAMVTSLPRRFEETETIALKLKRRLRYKSSYHFENVRPGKIFAAAEWLIGNSVLFREEGIKLDPSWFKPEWEGAESVEFRINSADDDSCIQGEKTNHAHSCDGGKQPECDAVSVKQCSNVPPQDPEHLVTDQASSGTVKDNNKPEQDQDGNLQEEYADLFQEWQEENIPANDKDNTGEDDEDKEWVETSQEAELGGGCRDTLLHPNDFTTDGQAALNIAPGEGKHPLGLFMDKDCEEKSFPTIFCGQRRVDNSDRMKPLTYSKICKAELRSADRRAAHSIANIFFKLKKLQMLQIRDLATTALRKVKGAKTGHTAGQLRKDGAIEDLLRQDQGYRVLKTLRSSPPYWQAKQKDLFAMIRQLGRPTFFATFSAAETRWIDLLRVLYRMEHSVDPTDDDLENLTWQEKSQLIQKDPVTCARHFDYRVQVLFRKVILSDLQPLGKVTDHFFRVEFQQRGSPHIHCMIWVEDAPKADTDSDEDVVAFLDKHLTCQRHEEGELKNVSSLHEHKHSKSCKKGGKHVCRFGFPLPPMSKTMMLRPLTQSEAKDNSGITENLRTIKRELSQLKLGENISFEEFLARVGIDENQYILALRSDLDSTKIFLQREPSATRMNSRNDILAQVWMANTDVQFVLDEYACGMYIVTYISKSQRGMSDLLKHADDEAKRGNHSVKQKVRHIANKFLNHCEVSAQEAVYLLMQLPLTRCTRDVIFVNTSPPCQRVGLLKNSTMLEAMKDEDTDVTLTSLIDRYSERPKELENICLADFATSYDVRKAGSSSRTGKNTKKKEQDFLPEGEYEEDATDNIWNNDSSSGHLYKLPDGKVLHHRRKPKVLRCVRFSLESDSENHYREKLMLYIPWRNEDKDIIGGCGTYHERFEQMKETVFEVSSKFETNATAVDQAVEQVQKDGIDEEAWDGVAPQAQDMESRHEKYNTESTINAAFQPDSEQHRQYDIGLDLGCHATSDITHDRIVNRIPNEEFDAMVRSLNCSQQTFFYHILHWMKTKCSGSLSACEPFHCFLSGGAGVGKSRCVLAIYHALVRYLSSRPGDNPDCLRVLLAAPTGKAAYNIRGVTLHTAFCLPANQSLSDYVKLDASRLNTLRSTLAELRLVIIDEISMVGANMMGFVSQRLQQLMGCSKPFGGVSVLAVGDLFQLRPVMDRWVFQPSRGPYEALAPIVWQELFQMFELTQVMRQKDDRTFAEALNRIREGCHTKEDASLIKSRVVKSSIPDNMLHLFTSRRLVTEQNTKSLALLQSSEILLEAKDSVMGDISVALKTEILHKACDMTVQQTQSLPSHLTLKVGGRFMLVHNVDISDGLTNGASGTLRQVGHKGSEKPEHVSVVWIEFDEESVGEKTRHRNKQLYTPAISSTWTPIFHAVKQFRVGKRENVAVLRKQFPLTACSAITVHKSQGSTLEQVAVSFQGMAQHHLVYVALSRAKTLGGLHLLDFDPNKIRVSPDVKTEMERLRKKPIEWCVSDLQQFASNGFLIGFHNSRSLHKHIGDLRLERNLLRAEMLFIFESWEQEQDEPQHYSLPEFKVLERNPAPTKTHRPHAGTIVYIRDDSLLSTSNTATSRSCNHSIEVTVLDASSRIAGLSVVGVYCPPGVKTSALRTELETILHRVLASQPYVVMGGDFNSDASDRLSKPLEQLCQEFSLRQLITEPTTDYGSVLDLIFTNLPESAILGGVLESWYSDHKPCWVSISV